MGDEVEASKTGKPTLKGWFKGAPPEGHARQCKRVLRSGNRCRKWALTGKDNCQFHGGRRKSHVRNHHLPMFYSKYLTQTLNEAVEAQLEMSSDEQLSLQEELALMRVSSCDAVKLFSDAKSLPDAHPDKLELVTAATAEMQASLQAIAAMCKDAVSIEAARRDLITPMHLKLVVNQLVRLLYVVCGVEHEAIAREFETKVETELRLPSDTKGTDLTPEKDVQEMLNTVPKTDI